MLCYLCVNVIVTCNAFRRRSSEIRHSTEARYIKKHPRVMRIKRRKVLTLISIIFIAICFARIQWRMRIPTVVVKTYENIVFVNRPACVPPNLDVNHQSIKTFFKPVDSLSCPQVGADWIQISNATVRIKSPQINCSIFSFWRINDREIGIMRIPVKNGTASLKADFFSVSCINETSKETFKNVYATIINRDHVSHRHKSNHRTHGSARNQRNQNRLNVYMFGFDSVSRLIAVRKLPKMLRYLTEELGAIILEGYNIVGDGTPQALIPILTGSTEPELPLTRKRFAKANFVNVYPFIWNNFSEAGYATLYGEDAAEIGTFTYRLKGFDKQPTDHFMRTFYMIAEREDFYNKYCIGHEPQHLVHFRYVEDFFNAYTDRPKFAFQFHSLYSHYDYNKIAWADDYFVEHLKTFKANGWANNTVFIAMSDHGPRFADFRQTQQGKLEERLPLMAIAMPSWFKQVYPDAYRNLP